jgi:prepilin-type N-terminal cleavage/methylation domain-containing protein
MLNKRFFRRAARIFHRGGFTLVELLVVIGIIAILAGVALGPITRGIAKAQQNAAVQQSHAIGLAMFAFANDNNQLYPDLSNPNPNSSSGSDASKVAWALINGSYVADPGQFWISGGKATKYAGSTATSIGKTNISFDFAGAANGAGLSTTAYPFLPLFWNSSALATYPTVTVGSAIVFPTPSSSSAFQTTGMAIFFCDEHAAFITTSSGSVTAVSAGSVTGSVTPSVLTGGD